MLAQCTNRYQAEVRARQYQTDPQPELELTDRLGEEPMVLRVRKTPTYWSVENWPRSLLQSEDVDVSFP